MKIKLSLWQFQVIGWGLFLLLFTMYTTNIWDYPVCGFVSAAVATLVYAGLVYTQALWLFPRFFLRADYGKYLFWAFVVLGGSVVVRMAVNYSLPDYFDSRYYGWTAKHFTFVLLTNSVAFVFGGLARIAVDYLKLIQTQDKMRSQQWAAELSLLKSQVQPHFLFNTLNNIYFLAHTKSDLTTEAIDRLAQIMRYFTEQAPKPRVPLSHEVAFLENYIALEMLRLPNPMSLKVNFPMSDTPVPPMLLMPFVENLFKHGVDKTRMENAAEIDLRITRRTIQFRVRNLACEPCSKTREGIGLANLKKRLDLHYETDYTLECRRSEDGLWYEAWLEIPLDEKEIVIAPMPESRPALHQTEPAEAVLVPTY